MTVALARRTDPITSHLAAARACEFAASHCQLILDYLRDVGAVGANVDELAARTGLTAYQVSKRMIDLERARTAEPTGRYRRTLAGRLARVWRAVP